MSLLPLTLYPDPLLNQVAHPVTRFDASLHTLVTNMLETMYAYDGIGLAAPQVGVRLRVVVMDIPPNGDDDIPPPHAPIVFINPQIIWASKGLILSHEGCLSIPGFYGDVERHAKIKVRYWDLDGTSHVIKADGLLSRCIQHEIDHLDGILFLNHLPSYDNSYVLQCMRDATSPVRDKTQGG